MLGYRDSGMAGSAANADPRAFMNADLDEAAARLASIMRALRPQVVVTYDARRRLRPPDHKMAHRVTRRALELAAHDARPPPRRARVAGGWQVAKLYYTAFALEAVLRVNEQMRARGLEPPFGEDNPDFDIRQFTAPDE